MDPVFVDAHVHLHACFDLINFLQSAYKNFEQVAHQEYASRRFTGMLCLTEGPNENGFDRLLECREHQYGDPRKAALRPWQVHDTEEDVSLRLAAGEEKSLIVIAGQQVATQEQLEVLAIGTRQLFEEGRPTESTLHEVAQAGALPVVPWGFGKWIGKRGDLIQRLIHDSRLPRFFLGDNANRPTFLPRSSLFEVAAENGVLDLPGSDPLPFPRECRRPGQAGFVLEPPLNMATPARDLKEKLKSRHRPLRTFMQCETPYRFVRNQLAMQYRKFANR